MQEKLNEINQNQYSYLALSLPLLSCTIPQCLVVLILSAPVHSPVTYTTEPPCFAASYTSVLQSNHLGVFLPNVLFISSLNQT